MNDMGRRKVKMKVDVKKRNHTIILRDGTKMPMSEFAQKRRRLPLKPLR